MDVSEPPNRKPRTDAHKPRSSSLAHRHSHNNNNMTQAPPSPQRSSKDSARKRIPPNSPSTRSTESKLSTTKTATTTVKRRPSRTALPASSSGKSLLPRSERQAHSHGSGQSPKNRARQGSSCSKCQVAPDGGSAGREGRHFAVASVGNNGKIYLRPSVRPAHLRQPQPNFTFPITPPDQPSPDEDRRQPKPQNLDNGSDPTSRPIWSPEPGSTPMSSYHPVYPDSQTLPLRPPHRRAVSDSTIQEAGGLKEIEHRAFKIVISKHGSDGRPKTMEDVDPYGPPKVNVDIPSWKVGRPQLTARGTLYMRGSSYAPSEDSQFLDAVPGGSRKPSSQTLPYLNTTPREHHLSPEIASPNLLRPLRSTYLSSHQGIEPQMFDALTFKPHCDDRTIVRYSAVSGAVTAATPPRLVAEITSPTFLDYELISDFFLTFRIYLDPVELLKMLLARLRWAIERDDECGTIVRVRTFVALRHWLLNYFMSDFVVDHDLRSCFCDLVNAHTLELAREGTFPQGKVHILKELKKCWRRICAQYWDDADLDGAVDPDEPIHPGGIAGRRNPQLGPDLWQGEAEQPNSFAPSPMLRRPPADASKFYADLLHLGHVAAPKTQHGLPSASQSNVIQHATDAMEFGPASPTTLSSLDITSCSFPGKHVRPVPLGRRQRQIAHPVAQPSQTLVGPVATTPKSLTGKRVRSNSNTHRHRASQSNSSRENSLQHVNAAGQELAWSPPYNGSLVRGDFLPPTQPFVDVAFPNPQARQTTIFQPESGPTLQNKQLPDAMSGSGMRKLLLSVRKAVGARSGDQVPSGTALQPIGSSHVVSNRVPGTAVVPQTGQTGRAAGGPHGAVRIDILAARVAENFKTAVQQEDGAGLESATQQALPTSQSERILHSHRLQPSLKASKTMPVCSIDQLVGSRPRDTAVTTGSKSIIIGHEDIAHSTTRVTAVSGTALDGSYPHLTIPNGANPTPPNTPPLLMSDDTPRQSSMGYSTAEPASPDISQFVFPVRGDSSPGWGHKRQHSSRSFQNRAQPPLSMSSRIHRRNKSTRTQRSLNSIIEQHVPSIHSRSVFREASTPGLDASQSDASSSDGADSLDAALPPARMLRRRPGGDLRDAMRVGDLHKKGLRKSHSIASFSTFSESMRGSWVFPEAPSFQGAIGSPVTPKRGDRGGIFSVGQLTSKAGPPRLSLISAHSSGPPMRPSFEIEATKLSQIPDDEEHGGIESALLKLEGKEGISDPEVEVPSADVVETAQMLAPDNIGVALGDPDAAVPPPPPMDDTQPVDLRAYHRTYDPSVFTTVSSEAMPASSHDWLSSVTARRDDSVSGASDLSSDRLSVMEAALDHDHRATDRVATESGAWPDQSILNTDSEDETPGLDRPPSTASFEFIQKPASLLEANPVKSIGSVTEEQSFLNDDSDNDDISTDLSTPDANRKRSPDPWANVPLPSKAATEATASNTSSRHGLEPQLHANQIWPTPSTGTTQATPTPSSLKADIPQATSRSGGRATASAKVPEAGADPSTRFSVHLPYILAFDSLVLAQQFTLIEKDALNEIDWKELIEMRWKNAPIHSSRSWVDFLRDSDAHGVEVVIARFNIMVKWAVSEILLTQRIEERASCIIKLIHVAAHCRTLCNFATLAQITIALSSNEIARLGRTWNLVPATDVKTLKSLESLVTPTRNFYNLRAEMEAGPETACIPFVGIYTHDLLVNAQRPAEIASTPSTAPLIHFERCRTAAAVVKTLLRLIEASGRYKFAPVEGVIERCLWIGALGEEDIRRLSSQLD